MVNYFNHQIGGLHTASEMNNYCRGYLQKFKNAYFLMLHYEEGKKRDEMNFEDLQEYYSTLPEREAAKFQEKMKKLNEEDPDGQASAP